MSHTFRAGEEYRNKGNRYKKSAEDEFMGQLVPDDRFALTPPKGIKFLDTQAPHNTIGPYAASICVSSDDDKVYPDEIDLEAGTIRYWGDAKRKTPNESIDIDSFTGNSGLKPQYDQIKARRRSQASPVLFFEKERSGYVRFCGLCVIDAVTRDAYLQQFGSERVWTPNYLYHLSVLDVDEVDLEWIHNRALNGSDTMAPPEWTAWKDAADRDPGTQKDSDPDEGLEEIETDTEGSTAGTRFAYTSSGVRVSESFRKRAFDLYGKQYVLTEMVGSPLVTLAHIVPRSEALEYAEDIQNVVLLNWTHHKAFDAGYFTIDEELRIRVNPDFETRDPHLLSTIVDREGEQLELPEGVTIARERIRERNETLS